MNGKSLFYTFFFLCQAKMAKSGRIGLFLVDFTIENQRFCGKNGRYERGSYLPESDHRKWNIREVL